MRLRTKIVEIDAELWDGTWSSAQEIIKFAGEENLRFEFNGEEDIISLHIWNKLENQWINTPFQHYVLKGLKGEFYPCEPEALFMKYDIIDG